MLVYIQHIHPTAETWWGGVFLIVKKLAGMKNFCYISRVITERPQSSQPYEN